jgi:N-ethylmaleimide reductase
MNLFSSYQLGPITLQNRIVMAPMTRCRAIGNVPNDLMAEYYGQRSSAGLIVSEGVAPSPNGLGYARIPGAYTAEQVEGWKKVATAAHEGGARIFMQFMHCGRISNPANMPAGAEIVAPSAVKAAGEQWTDTQGMQPFPTPRALETSEIAGVIEEHVRAARNAIAAGFDGIELHGANGYLTEQFLNPSANKRTDAYGGSWQNRNRFAIECIAAIAHAIGPERTGIRLSPANTFNDMALNPDADAQYTALCKELGALKIAYIHIVNYQGVGEKLNRAMKQAFGRTVIVNGGLDKAKLEAAIAAGLADLGSFGASFLANPDLPQRMAKGLALNEAHRDTFFSGDPAGYTDYPAAA